MPRFVKTAPERATAIIFAASETNLALCLSAIADSALAAESAADTAAVVYEQLARLGIIAP